MSTLDLISCFSCTPCQRVPEDKSQIQDQLLHSTPWVTVPETGCWNCTPWHSSWNWLLKMYTMTQIPWKTVTRMRIAASTVHHGTKFLQAVQHSIRLLLLKDVSHHISQLHVLAHICGAIFRLNFLKVLHTIKNGLLSTRFHITVSKIYYGLN